MLTEQRQELILKELNKKGIVKVNQLVEITNSSESTIRRDLSYLEQQNKLKRVHGGAALLEGRFNEESFKDKLVHNKKEKVSIAKYATSLIEEGDSIYLDAGTTTYEMAKLIDKKDILVVTNGVDNVDLLLERGIDVYILGGKIKPKTKAVVGSDALKNLEKFRFDKVFIGINSIHLEYGLTTPDTEEAIMKKRAIDNSTESFVLADHSKFDKISFVKVIDISDVIIITDKEQRNYSKYTEIEVTEQ